MLIDRREAFKRSRQFFVTENRPYADPLTIQRLALVIQQAVLDTAEECARIAMGDDLWAPEIARRIRLAFRLGEKPKGQPEPTSQSVDAPETERKLLDFAWSAIAAGLKMLEFASYTTEKPREQPEPASQSADAPETQRVLGAPELEERYRNRGSHGGLSDAD